MKYAFALVLLALVGLSQCRPQPQTINYSQQQNQPQAYILRYENDNDGLGSYRWVFETSDAQKHAQIGQVSNPETENGSLAVEGQYSYVGPDGVTYTVHYIADENGFQPAGDHLPQSAGVRKLGVPSAALASLAGGGLG